MIRHVRYLAATVVLVLGLGLGAGFVSYHCLRAERGSEMAAGGDALAWLRSEFALGERQAERIAALHAAHRPVCDEHCAMILEARATLRRLEERGAPEAEREAARAEARRIDLECRASVEAHFAAVAEVIGGAEGDRFLQLMRRRASAAAQAHAGAPALRPEGDDEHERRDDR